jgi:hypothetical protein
MCGQRLFLWVDLRPRCLERDLRPRCLERDLRPRCLERDFLPPAAAGVAAAAAAICCCNLGFKRSNEWVQMRVYEGVQRMGV